MYIFILFCVVTFIQLLFFSFFYYKFSSDLSVSTPSESHPISVIICAKNEAKNLAENLPLIAKQKYPDFEIVLVDDFSSDNSLNIMQQFQKDFSSENCSIVIISPEKNVQKGKKKCPYSRD